MKVNYLCTVPENEQAFLIYDEVLIDKFTAEYPSGDIEQWTVTILYLGKPVLITTSPLPSFKDCLSFLSVVVPGTPQCVG